MILVLLVALPFVASVVAALMPANARNLESTLAGLVALAGLAMAGALFGQVQDGGVVRHTIHWLPALGLDLALRMDGFAWMFAMLVTGIGALVVLYARYYMSPADPVPRFFSFLLAFMGAMMGVVLSGNLIQLVLFWELTSLFSFLLIGYWHHRADARRGARMALAVTGAGGLCLLAGVLLIGHVVGSYDLDRVLAAGPALRAHPLYAPLLVLVLAGAFTKSAQFPFHFWLPHAMAAPTPVSAYLHSATMVKAGVFLLARLWPALSNSEQWFWMVGGAGACTLVLGAFFAMFHRDLKGLLAYSTISHLGLITLLLGLNSPLAAVAAVFHIMNHATFKASLFMAAGIVDHETGTRDLTRLGGLFRAMPFTGTLAVVASAAMAGVPLLNGFLSKEMFFAEAAYVSAHPWVETGLPVVATVAGAFAVAYSLRLGHGVFFGAPATDLPRAPHEPPRWMRAPVELLVLACLVVGIFPAWSIGPALRTAALPVTGAPLPEYSLAIWHGVNAPLVMSLVALAAGAALYLLLRVRLSRTRLRCDGPDDSPRSRRLDGKRLFEASLAALQAWSRRAARRLGTTRLQPQLFWITAVTMLAAAAALAPHGLAAGGRPRTPLSPAFLALAATGMVCAVGAAWQAKYHRLAALAMLSVVGLVTCLTFVWFSAPDLALTQLMVETVTTVLFLLGLRWLPRRIAAAGERPAARDRARRARDLLLAGAAGAGMTALAWAVMTRPFPQSVSPYFLAQALSQGGGTNVVNVMLVDFRGFDTLGEVTVLGAVALTVYALLHRFRPPRESVQQPLQQRLLPPDLATDLLKPRTARDTAVGYLTVPAMLARLVLPLAVLVAAHLFLRGHNAPGGGFVAGLVVATALIVQYMVAGTVWVESHLRLRPRRWIAAGLLIATATGLASLAFGYPFLTTHTAHLRLPLLGEGHFASAVFFDAGVFAVVVGATLMILTALAHQSVRTPRRPASAPEAP